ncbi:preprotein translocase subunit SecE [bacterium K02(2017)]|nr:preprotein translocase subunit SecE [bacterium K02(2017)]
MKSKKIVNICLIIAALFLYYIASQIVELIFDNLNLPITREFGLTVPEIISVFVALISYVIAIKNSSWMGFLNEAVTELSKVTYPTKKESGQSAVVAIVMVSVATVFLAIFDSFWSYVTQLILSN